MALGPSNRGRQVVAFQPALPHSGFSSSLHLLLYLVYVYFLGLLVLIPSILRAVHYLRNKFLSVYPREESLGIKNINVKV